MATLRLNVGDTAEIVIDANQVDSETISLNDGPVESYLNEHLGWLDAGTRIYGRIWTGGPNVIIRYYEARPVEGPVIPFCGVARLAGDGMRKLPGSVPGNARLQFAYSQLYIVDAFR